MASGSANSSIKRNPNTTFFVFENNELDRTQLPELPRAVVEEVLKDLEDPLELALDLQEISSFEMFTPEPVDQQDIKPIITDIPSPTVGQYYYNSPWVDFHNYDSPAPSPDSQYYHGYGYQNSPEWRSTDDEMVPSPTKKKRRTRRCLTLWRYILQLLCEAGHEKVISWQDQDKGIFTINDSKKLAELWGIKKNRPEMTYEHLARAIRHYYKLKIMTRIPGKRLVYKFGQEATGWKTIVKNNIKCTFKEEPIS